MAILAQTPLYLVETVYGSKGDKADMITIARFSDGHAVALSGRGIVAEFRKCLKTHSPEKVTEVFLKIPAQPLDWTPCFKPHEMAAYAKREALA